MGKNMTVLNQRARLFAVLKARTQQRSGLTEVEQPRQNSIKEKPPPLRVRSHRGAASKDAGVGGPQDAKNRSCGPFIPNGAAWEHQRAWHRPGNTTPEWRHCFRAFPPPLRCAPSRSHAPLLSPSRTEERQKKPWGFIPWRSVTDTSS